MSDEPDYTLGGMLKVEYVKMDEAFWWQARIDKLHILMDEWGYLEPTIQKAIKQTIKHFRKKIEKFKEI